MRLKLIIFLVIASLLFLGCAKQEKAEQKNMEQIYKEEGIPVEVQSMQPETFVKELSYNATLTGMRQSAASAMIGGRIEKVHVKVGDYVKKDQVMFEFPEDAPAGQMTQAKAAYDLAESTYNRMQNLYEKGGISKQDLDGVETQYEVAKANLDAVLQMLKVRAPIDGYVTSVSVQETDGVHAETVLALVSQTRKMKARIWATEDEVCQMKTGQKATATWNGITLIGKVTEVAISMDMAHNAFGVDLVFDNSQNMCKSGVIGEIAIQTYVNDKAFVIERSSVKDDMNGMYVFIAQDGKAVKSYIQTGQENGSFEIIDGIAKGDQVIVKGLNLVTDGAKVKIVATGN
ncbi:MAG: efflux RND transporter periplasmic adaptor subunit [Candidatus Cloacimonetes bacterium]|nr:efflux RND transporter periplasmic adaptor subunit [Candidatus Cloacimonadota bacterium]MCF7814302.1 efflux RND transporter periplasmic adaptor subunit [Candidatus Cloacimonadota bacterium]MCF7868379.1 efflux RND transporter periplasmic adaptor subunit [Candidatus Cloacimonadota bacterium]MCF7883856.1 efflux RND transporter periplasmic adaptor subunit [Candidatus Cloacimonadota bacterium]